MTAAASRPFPVWILVSLAWIIPALLASLRAYVLVRLGKWAPATWQELVWEGGDWLLYALLTPLVFWCARRFPITRNNLAPRLALHLAASLGLCAAWAMVGELLEWAVFSDAPPTMRSFLAWFITSLPFGVAVYFAILAVAHAIAYFLEARDRETQAARLSAQLADARLGALHRQMQPHFLLNSLNAITVIVRDRDTATATRMLEQLGEMLRRVMRADRPPEVPLGEELEFVRQFLAIEEVRFSDRLRPQFAVDTALEFALVPEFVLQPLVENALRHGLAKRLTATLLRVEARREGDDLVLSVTDDGPGPGGAGEARTEGVGLANTGERLATLYGSRARLDLVPLPGGGATAIVRLPWHEAERSHG